MTPSEFKAWFEGFTESMDGPPSLKQWERIQARVKQITGHLTSYPVFVDRYVPASRPIWAYPYSGMLAVGQGSSLDTVALSNTQIGGTELGPDGHMAKFSRGDGGTVFDSHAAMSVLGRADADELARA